MQNRTGLFYALLFTLALLPAAARADEVAAPILPGEMTVAPATGERLRPGKASPMVTELLRLVEVERQALTEVRAAMAQTADPSRRLALQRQVEKIKRDTERALLRTQIEFARREGRTGVASELEAALLRLDGVPVPAPPAATVPTAPSPAVQAP